MFENSSQATKPNPTIEKLAARVYEARRQAETTIEFIKARNDTFSPNVLLQIMHQYDILEKEMDKLEEKLDSAVVRLLILDIVRNKRALKLQIMANEVAMKSFVNHVRKSSYKSERDELDMILRQRFPGGLLRTIASRNEQGGITSLPSL